VIHGLRDHVVDAVPTYLGAHVLPEESAGRRDAYIELVMETLPAARRWAEYCDVWCDTTAFTADETERICRAALALGFKLRLHADLSAGYNPGTSPTPSLQTVMRLAVRPYRLGDAEVWHMVTINGAHALDRGGDRGSLEPGKRADLVTWWVPEHGMVINRFGVNLVETMVKDGRVAWRAR
jgi:imidazolonepropionase-like amidohydrolase